MSTHTVNPGLASLYRRTIALRCIGSLLGLALLVTNVSAFAGKAQTKSDSKQVSDSISGETKLAVSRFLRGNASIRMSSCAEVPYGTAVPLNCRNASGCYVEVLQRVQFINDPIGTDNIAGLGIVIDGTRMVNPFIAYFPANYSLGTLSATDIRSYPVSQGQHTISTTAHCFNPGTLTMGTYETIVRLHNIK